MRKNKFITLIAALSVAAVLTAGCGGNSGEEKPAQPSAVSQVEGLEIEDDLGRKIVFDKKPERIAVTSASFLEPLHEVGGEIVGRPDSKTKMPDWAKDIASVGQVYQIDTERLLACKPDLVIINKGMNEKLLGVLEENKIPALVVEMKTYDDVKREIQTFAKINGNAAKGEDIVKKMDGDIQSVIDKVPKEKKRVAILHSTAQGLSVQLEGSIAGNIVKMFGWENVAANMTPLEKNPDAAPYSMETLAEQNPEIIFITSMGKIEDIKANMQKSIETNEAWQAIGAIKNKQVYYLPQDLFLLSPGLHYPEAVRNMAELIYPDEFKN